MLHTHEIEQDIQNIQAQASTSVNNKGTGNYFNVLNIYIVHTRYLFNFSIFIYILNILKFIFIDFSVFF